MNQRDRSSDERQWISFLGVPLERVRAHFWVFSACFVATLVFYTYVHAVDAANPSWRQAPSLIIGDTTRAAAFWVLASPIVVEGVAMVFAALYREKKRREAEEKIQQAAEKAAEQVQQAAEQAQLAAEQAQLAAEQAIVETHAAWREWNQRRMKAEAEGQPFTEPPPDFEPGPTGSASRTS